MHPSDLELFTSQELIAELLRRETFLGVVVHSQDEWKNEQWGEERMFKVSFNDNLCAPKVARLLDTVSEYIELQ